jgi:aryl-alcohol dehydrogenase-like predicted oxidoreductase
MRRRFGWNFQTGKQAKQLQQLEALRALLTTDGRTLAQGAISYIWAKSPGAIPIPGFKTIAQMVENAGAMTFGPLKADQVREVDTLLGRP